MRRRSFIKSICAIPLLGVLPIGIQSSEVSSNNISKIVGLNRIIDIIRKDKRLNRRVSEASIEIAIESAKRMNEIIIEAIFQTGVGNDKQISIADTRELNDYIFHHYHDEWVELHGNDEETEETGFHLVVNDGAKTKLFGRNAINKVADSIYHLGFETHLKNKLLNEDANKNSSYKKVSEWLNALLREDLEAGRLINNEIQEVVGESGTSLDNVIEIIYNDRGLQRHISLGDMRMGAKGARMMNKLLLEAIAQTNAGVSGVFTSNDIRAINSYLVTNNAKAWAIAYGDNKDNQEMSYAKVQHHGAKTKLFGKNAINRVFDAIYHLGFKTPYKNKLVNQYGNKNASFKKVALWLSKLLSDELSNQKEDLKILIPLYSYPNWYDDAYVWQTMIDTKTNHPDVEMVAIVNPSNGHFREKNSDYTRGIQDLIAAKIKVVGYVYTEYGERDTQEVISDIEAWNSFYKEEGVSGIFFDETSTDASLLNHYSNLSREARNRGLEYVILNPGITTDEAYVNSGIADVVVSYENPNRELLENPPTTYNEPSKSTELSLLVYEMEENNVDNLISFAREHKFSYIYFTEDGFDGNPWNSISDYFEEEVQKSLS